MRQALIRLVIVSGVLMTWTQPSYALDSYRFLHVTIDTPWSIFVFLLFAVLAPFVLMAILVWRYSENRAEDNAIEKESGERQE